ncbi:MAG: hypothetical protein Ct9H300mP8_10730 [Gammaproteobacteria bacterium]|nr:MAG: hypothetical protein Ct9H300mP8_10730 [Gammaproteobacteria bacterium]
MSVLAPYDLENFSIEGLDVLVNKPKVAAYRAPEPSVHARDGIGDDDLARELGWTRLTCVLRMLRMKVLKPLYGPKFPAIGLKASL